MRSLHQFAPPPPNAQNVSPNLALRLPTITTLAPSSASKTAHALPIPEVAPVTKTRFPTRFKIPFYSSFKTCLGVFTPKMRPFFFLLKEHVLLSVRVSQRHSLAHIMIFFKYLPIEFSGISIYKYGVITDWRSVYAIKHHHIAWV